MENRTLRVLEFPKLLSFMSNLADSEGGRRACLELKPFEDIEILELESRKLSQALAFSNDIREVKQELPDIQGVFDFLDQGDLLDEDALWAIRAVLENGLTSQKSLLKLKRHSDSVPDLLAFAESRPLPKKTSQSLNRCLSKDGEIKDESSPELLSIRQELRNIQKQCTQKVSEFLQQKNIADLLQDDYLTISADRYVLALKSNFKGRVSGIIHDYSQTGETCYFEPISLVELNNRLQEIKQEEREAKREVLRYLTSLVREEWGEVLKAYTWSVELDILKAKLELAEYFKGIHLEVSSKSPLRLKQVRHPLLLLEKEFVQDVDIELSSGDKGLIISGGNSGGKTICLKTLGLCALMALSALPVPAAEGSSLPYWKEVFIFMGDEQSLEENLSTFTAQISQFKKNWPRINEDSLILLDEFGAGTDPSQGAALAQGTIDCLLEKGAWVGASTHFPALKAYALSKEGMQSASVLFDSETKAPLYKLAYGQVGASQALDVARDHGMPKEILKRAQEYLLLNGDDSARLTARLNDLAVAREEEIKELERQREELRNEKTKVREKYHRELKRLIEENRTYAREVIQEWKKGKISRKKALKRLGQKKRELSGKLEERQGIAPDYWSMLKVGERVNCLAWSRQGKILEKDEKKKMVKLDLGGISVWASLQEIDWPEKENENPSESAFTRINSPKSQGFTLDLRGQRSEEAKARLYHFIDQALLQGRNNLEIIHGRGMGALRKTVHDCLKDFSLVETFYLAPENQGGDGVTLVQLK